MTRKQKKCGSNSVESDLKVPNSEISAELRNQLKKAQEAASIDNSRRWKDCSSAIRQIQADYVRDLHTLIGPANLPLFRKLHQRRVKGIQTIERNNDGQQETLRKLATKRERNRQETEKLRQRAGISSSAIKDLQHTHKERLQEEFKKFSGITDTLKIPSDEELHGSISLILDDPFFSASIWTEDCGNTNSSGH